MKSLNLSPTPRHIPELSRVTNEIHGSMAINICARGHVSVTSTISALLPNSLPPRSLMFIYDSKTLVIYASRTRTFCKYAHTPIQQYTEQKSAPRISKDQMYELPSHEYEVTISDNMAITRYEISLPNLISHGIIRRAITHVLTAYTK